MSRNMMMAAAVAALCFGAGSALADMRNGAAKGMQEIEANQKLTAQDFATRAMSGNMFEIEAGKIALEKTKNDKVKEFAEMMVDDHTKAKENLTEAIEKSDFNAQVPAQLSSEHAAIIEKLKAANEADFDKLYIEEMKAAHTKTLAMLVSYTRYGQDGPLKEFATDTVKTVNEHHTKVNELTL